MKHETEMKHAAETIKVIKIAVNVLWLTFVEFPPICPLFEVFHGQIQNLCFLYFGILQPLLRTAVEKRETNTLHHCGPDYFLYLFFAAAVSTCDQIDVTHWIRRGVQQQTSELSQTLIYSIPPLLLHNWLQDLEGSQSG